jgi:aspartate-semialdehyde dehydrogenase
MADTMIPAALDIADRRLFRSFAYIGGKWRAAASGETVRVTDPATGKTVGEVASLAATESAAAVDAAQAAFPGWSGFCHRRAPRSCATGST